ncbi:unnamed protein product [Effrenium voratum]|uniref:Kinesin-like protein n=1 Tax=Effrenium voratum TaxID=2562239 RepID=A0AA36IS13_9DINO|nr:unnamed protein product [Effrenium voratum]
MAQDDEDEEDEDVLLDGGPPSPASPDRESDTLQERGDNIRVFVRVRPLNAREESAHLRDSICVDTDTGTVHLLGEPPRSFAFDGVLGVSASQEDVFQLFGTSVAEACLSGYNGSIYAYGQTGSGKTFTMQGGVNSVQSMQQDPSRGLMCRILEFIFDEISRRHLKGGSVQHSCKCSYLEIYKEQITDLLEPSSYLQIREDINRGIYVERLSEHSVWTASDAFHVLWKGLHQRHVASTQMNELSSRSHSVFTLKLEASSTTAGGVTSTKVARLNLIDLAGSERQSFDPHQPSTHESLRVKEAGAINRSLSALTNVIMSLSQRRAGQRQPFVRYRDSKLTFLLRDSLGGNSKTHIAACVSPSAMCFGETLSTLKFAARAKHIRCTAVMNEEYSGTVESLMLEVKSLRQQLDLLSSRGLLGDGEVEDIIMQSPKGMAQRGAKAAREEEEALEALVLERLEAAGCREELQSLYGSRRVRRLEILLAAALDRERRCELRRHKMDKYSQYLNYTLEKKETYFDALRDYFSSLVDANEEGDKKVGEGKFQAPKHFPGIEEVTHLSSSDSESEDRPREAGLLDRGVYADANSFLPAMARQVQDLFRVKNGMEDLLRRRLSAQKATSPVQGDRFIRANVTPDQEVEVDPQELAEALQGATEALQNAEAMVAKGGCGELFVGADEPHAPDHGRRSEGMDERDVFLSLMRSLPGESQALNRQGFAASVPQLEPFDSESDRMSSLRSTSSISSGGGRLTRMKSTMQLHRIVEAPSLQEMAETVREGSSRQPPSSPSETLQLAVQQVQNLCKQLEGVGEVYRDVKAQLEPMQQEYLRRQEECRFLEAQCRRLDVHCRLLENRVQAAEASGALRAPQPQPFNPDAQLPAPGARRFIPVAQAQAPVVGMARMSIMAHVASALLAARWISGNPTPVAFAEPPFLSTRAVIAQPRRPAMQALRDGAQAWSSSFAFLCAVTAANGVNHARRIETHRAKASWCVLGSPKQRTPKQCARG